MAGGLAMDLWGFLIKDVLQISTRNYTDWTSVVLYGFIPSNWYEFLFAFGAHILWAGFLGICFAYLLPKITPQGFRIKGAFFGFIVGFLIYGIAILSRMPFFTEIPFHTSASNAIGGIIWGITTAQVLYWLDVKTAR
jgi:uncharacterized membrane protein YagU involved in acid resistance